MKVNPFRPNSPVAPGMFSGRLREIEKLEYGLLQTKEGNSQHFLITGERGIGKTSLLSYIAATAEGFIKIEETELSFLVVQTDIDKKTTQAAFAKKIELALNKALAKNEKTKTFFKETWDFLRNVQAAGIKLGAKEAVDEDIFLENLAYSLAETVNKMTDREADGLFSKKYDGLIVLIDEADNSSKELDLGVILKLLTERLIRSHCGRVMIILSGLPQTTRILADSHESAPRIFDELKLEKLTDKDVEWVIDRCLTEASEKNKREIKISDNGKKRLIELSEGFPHYIQQFGYSAFEADTNDLIDTDDIEKGAFHENGALDQIGNRYYKSDFYQKIQKDSYRQVLIIMAEKSNEWITKKEIRAKFKGGDTALTDALQALRVRNIIISYEGEKGKYRLQHRGFAMWIKLRARKS